MYKPSPSTATTHNPLQGGIGGTSIGFNTASGFESRAWVDEQSSIIGSNSVTINVGSKDQTNNTYIQNTGNTNINGALIANINKDGIDAGNLTLNTNTLTYQDIHNYNNQDSNSFGLNLQAGHNPTNPAIPGNIHLTLSLNSSESSSDTKATIGKGTINVSQNTQTQQDILSSINRDTTNIEQNKTHIITSDFNSELKIDLRLIAAGIYGIAGSTGKALNIDGSDKLTETASANWNDYLNGVVKGAEMYYKITPMGTSEIIEGYTGQELSWEPGDVARFKEKGREFETSVPGALTIGKANTISTDPNDPEYDPKRLKYIGQPISADVEYYEKKLKWANEGGGVSSTNFLPGFNSMSVFHDKFTQETFLGKPGFLELSIIPSIPINYYGLIGKSIRNLYEEPKNNLAGGKQ